MDRFALFVDAGYLYHSGGLLCCGTTDRSRLRLSLELPDAIAKLCSAQCTLPHLRTYWYDAAESLIPTAAQQDLARLPGVKMRLGRLTVNGQKGVDSLVVRDMIRLASEHAVPTAYLLSGDEDLRAGVAEAQDYGVKVVLVGIESARSEQNQSIPLLREADDYLTLNQDFLTPFFELLPSAEAPGEYGLHEVHIEVRVAFEFGRDFGFTWVANAAQDDLTALATHRPQIPQEIDIELIQGLVQRTQVEPGTRFDFETRKALRSGFWSAIDIVAPATS